MVNGKINESMSYKRAKNNFEINVFSLNIKQFTKSISELVISKVDAL